MKHALITKPAPMRKSPTGIAGFDEMTGGGLPTGRTTLLLGGPGSGKTIFALGFLSNGVRQQGEPGIFVAFVEAVDRILANAHGLGWELDELVPDQLFFMDCIPSPDTVHAGAFDLTGMLAGLGAQASAMGARRVVFDALDVLLALLPDDASRHREVYRVHEWLIQQGLTALITAKFGGHFGNSLDGSTFACMQFMVDCTIVLNHTVELGVSQRNLRVQKYRGSSFNENESPFVIGASGLDVAIAHTLGGIDAEHTNERVTTGIKGLDTMLDGGYFRGASVLITGFPGTAKTTLSGAFAEAACLRGERTVFVSFDSDGTEVIRNLESVGIQLAPHAKSGLLRMVSARTITGSAENLLAGIKSIAKEHKARCVVIDPMSTLSKAGNEMTAHNVAERLIDWTKADGITLVCTSLLDEISGQVHGGTPLQLSTLTDTWIHLNYLVQAGERNRGMSIIKSRGTSHSNQVRELILSSAGVTLADTCIAGGEVLMGTMRREMESAGCVAQEKAAVQGQLKRVQLDAEEAEFEVRLRSLQTMLVAKQVEKQLLNRTTETRERELKGGRRMMREPRGADAAIDADPAP